MSTGQAKSMGAVWAGLLGASALLCGCEPNEDGPLGAPSTAPDEPAGEVFWQTFNAGRYEDIALAQATLEEEIEQAPDDGYLYRTKGVSHFWLAAESARDPSFTTGDLYGEATQTLEALERGRELAPEDRYLPCFLGLMQYELGSAIGDEALVESALAEFERGIELYPEFTAYCRALARASAPVGSQEFELALSDFMQVVALCEPTVTLQQPVAATAKGMSACTQRDRVPHGFNGIWLTGGDLFAKAGDLEVAEAFYGNAKLVAYEDWGYRATLEQRLKGVVARAALYADGLPGNDPVLAFHSEHACVMCHQR